MLSALLYHLLPLTYHLSFIFPSLSNLLSSPSSSLPSPLLVLNVPGILYHLLALTYLQLFNFLPLSRFLSTYSTFSFPSSPPLPSLLFSDTSLLIHLSISSISSPINPFIYSSILYSHHKRSWLLCYLPPLIYLLSFNFLSSLSHLPSLRFPSSSPLSLYSWPSLSPSFSYLSTHLPRIKVKRRGIDLGLVPMYPYLTPVSNSSPHPPQPSLSPLSVPSLPLSPFIFLSPPSVPYQSHPFS